MLSWKISQQVTKLPFFFFNYYFIFFFHNLHRNPLNLSLVITEREDGKSEKEGIHILVNFEFLFQYIHIGLKPVHTEVLSLSEL